VCQCVVTNLLFNTKMCSSPAYSRKNIKLRDKPGTLEIQAMLTNTPCVPKKIDFIYFC
jgi:hypothetical protein